MYINLHKIQLYTCTASIFIITWTFVVCSGCLLFHKDSANTVLLSCIAVYHNTDIVYHVSGVYCDTPCTGVSFQLYSIGSTSEQTIICVPYLSHVLKNCIFLKAVMCLLEFTRPT